MPLVYTADELTAAKRAIRFLAARARRGLAVTELGLLMFAAGFPVAHQTVVTGMRDQLDGAWSEMNVLLERATAIKDDIPPEWRRTDAFDHADAVARMEVDSGGEMAVAIRANLRKARQPAEDEDVHSVVLWLVSIVLGEPPPVDDDEIAHRLLYAFDAHGLVEPVFANGPVAVPEGPSAFVNAMAVQVRLGVFSVPDDVTEAELIAARDLSVVLGEALQTVPPTEIRHHLGGDGVMSFWRPDEPLSVAQLINYLVKLLREQPLDVAPIVAAVAEAGWCVPVHAD